MAGSSNLTSCDRTATASFGQADLLGDLVGPTDDQPVHVGESLRRRERGPAIDDDGLEPELAREANQRARDLYAPTTTSRGRTGKTSMNNERPPSSTVRDRPRRRAAPAAATSAASSSARAECCRSAGPRRRRSARPPVAHPRPAGAGRTHPAASRRATPGCRPHCATCSPSSGWCGCREIRTSSRRRSSRWH